MQHVCVCTLPHLLFELIRHIGEENLCVVLVADLAAAVEHCGDLVTPGQQRLNHREELEEVTLGPHLVDEHDVISMAVTREQGAEGWESN